MRAEGQGKQGANRTDPHVSLDALTGIEQEKNRVNREQHHQPGTLDRFFAGSPLGVPAFRRLYGGAVTTSMAFTMQSAMAGWLMVSLSGSATMVGLVQASATVPFLLFGLVSGSLSDLVERRHVLVVTHLMMAFATATVGILSLTGTLTPGLLVAMTLLCGLGYTFYQPAQQASINSLVDRTLLPRAVALGSIAFNAARSLGPALAGLVAAWVGNGQAVLLAALFFLPMLPASLSAVPPREARPVEASETLWSGIRSGLRFCLCALPLRSAILLNLLFCFCAAALWAMFPLVAQQGLGLAADGYGFLYSTFGLGAVVSALVLPPWLRKLPTGLIVRGAFLLWALGALIVAFSKQVPMAIVGTFLAGIAWVGVLASLSTVAQANSPAWVRARAVANNQIALQAGLAIGSLFWGVMVSWQDLERVLLASAVLLIVLTLLTRRHPLVLAQDEDVTPDDFMPPMLPPEHAGAALKPDSRVRVEYRYRPDPAQREAFLKAIHALADSRRRNGGLRWELLDIDREGFVERFQMVSWAECQRLPSRMMQTDRRLFEQVLATLPAGAPAPKAEVYLERPLGYTVSGH